MAAGRTVVVSARELRDAFDFVSAGVTFDHSAYISLDTGKIYWRSTRRPGWRKTISRTTSTTPTGIWPYPTSVISIGRRLALAFVAEALPDDYDTVAGFFRRHGAYGRFKDLLAASGKLERWYEFETKASDEALVAWCAEHGIETCGRRLRILTAKSVPYPNLTSDNGDLSGSVAKSALCSVV